MTGTGKQNDVGASVLAVGDELVSGLSRETNGPFAAKRLLKAGFRMGQIRCVGDREEEIVCALEELADTSGVVVVSGGLGPTPDDVTASSAARAAGVELKVDEESRELLRARLQAFGRDLTEPFAKQVQVPEGSDILINPVGTAPGFALKIKRALCFFLPGVPVEFTQMFESGVEPKLREQFKESKPVESRMFRVCALGESMLQSKVHAIVSRPGLKAHYLPHLAGVDLAVEWTGQPDRGLAELEEVERRVKETMRWKVYDTSGADLAEVVGRALANRGHTLSTAESCTGGLLGHQITEVPGSSRYFVLGVVVYSNEAKMRVLGVKPALLERHGAVSEPVVRNMAEAVRKHAHSTFGLAVSGIAGPDGGTPEKPVGTVHLALAADGGTAHVFRLLPGTRSQIKARAAYGALAMLHRHLTEGWLG